jgi:coenzyme F420-reducing hydrogenase beta subunit
MSMRKSLYGRLIPTSNILIDDADDRVANKFESVCPFSGTSDSETKLGNSLFPSQITNEELGAHQGVFTAHVKNDHDRISATSGGVITWLATQLLATNEVDGIIHVKRAANGAEMSYEYQISSTSTEVKSAGPSRYYPVSVFDVMERIKGDGKRYCFIGLPCFVKAVRLLCREDLGLAGQITHTIGMVCGHLKSTNYYDMMTKLAGLPDAQEVNFRKKLPWYNAHEYFVEVSGSSESKKIGPSKYLEGAEWGLGYFKAPACDACDDIYAECADVVVGDAWSEEYSKDWKGHSVVVVRAGWAMDLIEKGADNGLSAARIPKSLAISMQGGNFRHRRDGFDLRYKRRQRLGLWSKAPRFEVLGESISPRKAHEYYLRVLVSSWSNIVFERSKNDNLEAFLKRMRPLVSDYRIVQRDSLLGHVPDRFRLLIKRQYAKYKSVCRKVMAKKAK